ncbi:tRNA (adenosine(37)-N6)-dimethylallyltransferase MiaA [Candidatus Roizmanbacteria bacterium RIFCSPHIGHO2_02_FULL_37_15]|uniref:tRNA dimethylallyltransferase n=1 Tax=Candidatus Roizmanbacteria bacterium RIFCSPLOWO2_01_FULL_37_16 TaxID=1802058 RepID=A0A1F7INE6_9BACT|nr:MAG: tRNA (adenosine(37)-N6)-dimethylallyltransferase MiaA [Candidatus Roizmanbacteria bacterium RIFCSPHIGHO2_02_FULL_37_15]OGK44850.1 MAG: tRNA (adenosine(37)-N6)-dimethylallyltransferase MiaA [Candidatus Roizmanbacteria bacterium RIFCSPLOWO2_01_FULL_37_16]OGK57788.1 MAG: tRNA (adenosine(37)-N6)-dimethylallyltransferase MiaA [Candidatus Roizmanbacteria bacterium RIFCSPLOWO2_02_FULL_37_9]
MKIIIVTGQTATGKTKLALEYAKKYNGELINSDSRQIYRYLDIITGKDKQLLEKVKVWLYDIVNPDEYFSSFDFVKLAIPIIKKIFSKGKTPIIVGGTYFYLYHLLYNVDTENIIPDWKLRNKLENKSVKELQTILAKHSPQLIKQLNQSELNNPQRLIRKIEILSFRAKRQVLQPRELKILLQQSKNQKKIILNKKLGINNLHLDIIGLKFEDRVSLQRSIKARVGKRLRLGAVAEVSKLLKMGYSDSDPGLKTIGYQQLILHLKGVLDIDTAIQQWINKEIQYAKRQTTFMKKDKNITWRNV